MKLIQSISCKVNPYDFVKWICVVILIINFNDNFKNIYYYDGIMKKEEYFLTNISFIQKETQPIK